jgi:transposase
MSLRPNGLTQIPAETSRVARAAFPKGCLAMRARDALGLLFTDEQFAELFAARGRPAWSPARLALVLVLQFVEGLTDRQAADAVRARLDWKYALGLALDDPGFDASVLTEFRARLLADGQAERLLTLMLARLRERGLLRGGGRQRTDATHVHMAVRDLHRLEQVIETLRAALEALAVVAPAWLDGLIPREWTSRYGQRGDDWRLPKAEQARAERAVEVGRDGLLLLEAVYGPDAPAQLAGVEAVQVLRATWIQQFFLDGGQVRWRDKHSGLPPGSRMILNPYDPDARPGVKRGRNWRGYKAHFTETCEPDRPHLVTHVATTDAATADLDTVADRHRDLAARALLPEVHLVDAGYVSVGQILSAADDHGVQLSGPLPPDTSWQAGDEDAFDLTRFAIDWDARHVVCPQGKISRNWQPARSRDGLPIIRATFRQPDCRPCPDRARCTRSEDNARHVTFLPRRQQQAQQRLRAEQATDDWRRRYALRCGVESLISQASRRSDLHHARYRGLAKTHLQHVLTALAINLVRVDAWLTGIATTGSWTSRLTRLTQALPAT